MTINHQKYSAICEEIQTRTGRAVSWVLHPPDGPKNYVLFTLHETGETAKGMLLPLVLLNEDMFDAVAYLIFKWRL